ncbi:murinoglobulin-2-like isoform X1 [Cricetulus griseus]|uniref:murinoglobulin-2-like isoform X1 n=1 Tax=Cricetulus griseus TaxID=10029 RepID=UPI0015C3D966|nr:murinoglobulin-2-like isoform X1 [Cricetulus griseus]
MKKGRKALQCLLSVLLAFLPSASSFYGQPKFMALVPSQLRTETPEKICLHLYQLSEPVTVKASLQFSWGSRSLFNDLVVDKDMFHCVSFTLPRVSSSEEKVSLSVHVKGPKHEFSKTNVVMVKNQESVVFVQTDKPMYKPGQPVKFRVVAMDTNLHPLNELFPLAYIEDPKTNRIMQWRDINTENGLKQLSFSLSSEPILGSYKIVLQKQSGVKKEHYFTVEEFVLPRFEVRVKVPKAIFIKDEKLNVTVCGVYTYGKPVPGHVKIRTCHKYQQYRRQIETQCRESSYQLDNNGCSTQEEDITELQLKEKTFEDQYLHVNAKITEEGTGLEFSGSGSTKIERAAIKLIFVKADSHFKQGIPFIVKVRLVDVKGAPIPNEEVFIKPRELDYTNVTTTDQHGLAEFSINTTNFDKHSLTIKVYHKEQSSCFHELCLNEHTESLHVAHSVYSFSRSYIHLEKDAGVLPCSQTHKVRVHFLVKGRVIITMRDLTFYYLVKAKDSIIQTGSHTQSMEPEKSPVKGDFDLQIPGELSMAPVISVLVYTIFPNGEIIADSAKYYVEKCLLNRVDLIFTPARSLPASQVHLQVRASPLSLCGLRAVDQSVLLLRPEAELSPSWIYNLPEMRQTEFIPTLDQLFQELEPCVETNKPTDEVLLHPDEKDVYHYVKDMGLKAFTNLKIKHRKFCLPLPDLCMDFCIVWISDPRVCTYTPFMPSLGFDDVTNKGDSRTMPEVGHEDLATETIRKYFPETWIWDLVTVNSSGVTEMEVTVPDTITEWKAGALCLSNDTGLGLSPVVSLQAFQPFFVELTMPYSVIRGEAFTLKATVFNYLPTCIRVGVLLEDSPDFTAVPVAKDQDSHCLCANGRHTASWLVTPKSLGNVNFSVTAEAQQSPEPCGSEVATVPETGKKDTVVKVLIVEPEGIKKEHTFSSLLCASGENPSKQHFFKTQTKPSIPGYQRELNYKHKDGSYSSFGDQDGQSEGNTWLTAFVLKSFAQARAFIFVDETHITHAFTWLSQQQQDNGCFRSSGSMFNNAMKGGVKDEVTLSAYITIAFLESSIPDTHPVVSKALTCLESSWKTIQQGGNDNLVYTKALLAYAFALAGNQDKRNESYQRELNYKHKDGSYSSFGDQDGQSEGNTWLTAFVLKSFAQARAFIFIDEKHITHAFTWLSQQQQDNGCFRSSGSLFNNAMKGGVKDEVTLSAYITIAFLESSIPDTHPVVSKALTCLESSWKTIQQEGNGNFVYTKALLAYAFALAGNQDKRNEIMKSLDNEAIKEENSIHWERPQKPMQSERSLYKPQAPSAEVEMNAYVLLTLLTAQPAPTPEDLDVAVRIVKWLTKQQNPQGGFSSTQDTVVALHALSKYGAVTFAGSQKTPSVTIQSSGTFSRIFQIESSNRLLLQQVLLPDIPGDYDINVSGEGCVYAQTTLRYNVQLEKQESAFTLRVQTLPLTCGNPEGHNSFQISLEISYTGSRPASNMVIVDVKMVSGFIPLKPTVKKLERSEHVSKTEMSTNKVLLYVDQVTNQTLTFSFVIQQDIPVRNLQPAIVKVYDYYETDEVVFAEYSAPCSSGEHLAFLATSLPLASFTPKLPKTFVR